MGGSGSGRRRTTYGYTVEDCQCLAVNRWHDIIKPHSRSNGFWGWYADETLTKLRASIEYEIATQSNYGYARLHYVWQKSEIMDYRVKLVTTPMYFGGRQWWFECPNTQCGRRVGKLYQTPKSKYFLCRTCHRLTYSCCRGSHELDDIHNAFATRINVLVWAAKKIFMEGHAL